MVKVKIKGVGKYVPEKVLTNHDLEKMVDTSDEWITTRTGIKERHIIGPGETTSTMGAKAAEEAIRMSGISKDEIDLIICTTTTPDKLMPSTACFIQDSLKIPDKAGAFDLAAACAGFVYGLATAYSYIVSGICNNVLIVSSEALSVYTNWSDRNTCVLFGDGAGAVVVSRTDDSDDSYIMGFKLHSDGSYKDSINIPAGGTFMPASVDTINNKLHYMKMDGATTFKLAVKNMADTVLELTNELGLSLNDIDLLIPHQANKRIIDSIAERLGLPSEKAYVNLSKYGNTSAATIPIALKDALDEGKIKKGDTLALVALGAGYVWGASILKW